MASWYSRPNTVEMADGTEKTEYHLCFETFDKDEAKRIEETFKAIMDGKDTNVPTNGDTISRQEAINALWKALYEYEDKTEKQFRESDVLNVEDWIAHRIFVQNMSDIDRRTILELPSAQPERKTEKALRLLVEWAVECDFGYDNIPEEYEKYKDEIQDMGYTEGLIYIAEKEVEHD